MYFSSQHFKIEEEPFDLSFLAPGNTSEEMSLTKGLMKTGLSGVTSESSVPTGALLRAGKGVN